jgi:hypothetical protein
VHAGRYFAAEQRIRENSTQLVGKHCKSNHDVQHGDSADAHRKTVYQLCIAEF